jgi:UDP-N-acetylmuramoyl-tripeptide--D-alanyl-D-alanine ligase
MPVQIDKLHSFYAKWTSNLRWRTNQVRARLHRARCHNVRFVSVFGSSGKTTTKEFIAAILARRFRVHKTRGNNNLLTEGGVEVSVLGASPKDDFVVLEAGVDAPGQMKTLARLMKPEVAVMLCVRPAHIRGFGSLDAIAVEKGVVFDHVQPGGIAVVNADDPLVMREARKRSLRLRTFGNTSGCDVRLVCAESRWPQRLTLSVEVDGNEYEVTTQLLGRHWTNSVLAALAVGTHLGLTVDECHQSISEVAPFWARMQAAPLSNGVTFIRDEIHGEKFNYEVAFDFIRDARARRKVLLASTYAGAGPLRERMEDLGRQAASLFDYAIFIGERGNYAIRAATSAGMPRDSLVAFYKYEQAVEHVRSELRDGDLVLLKGRMDTHLSRLYLSMLGDVECKLKSCGHSFLCDGCPKSGFVANRPVTGAIAPANSNV